jgi:hypothetical protein
MAEKEMDLREDLQNKLRKTSEWVQRLKKMLIEGKVDPSPERILAKKIEEMTCNKIIQLMEQKDTRVLIIERKYLLELFNRQIIEISEDDALPYLSKVIGYLKRHNIDTTYDGTLIKFVKKDEEKF